MKFAERCEAMGVPTTPEQRALARLLEARGLRFCVHFGVDNLAEKACASQGGASVPLSARDFTRMT